jgi:molybdopterin-containing oxidoreductase family iron-sulfur binding subunit
VVGTGRVTGAADLNFAAALQKVKICVRLGTDENETSRYCHWHIPAAHYLESWSDVRAFDGTVSIIQPLVEPLYNGKTAHELIDAITRQPSRQSYDIVREYWTARNLFPDFEKTWRQALSDGVLPGPPISRLASEHPPLSSLPVTTPPIPAITRTHLSPRPHNLGWIIQ